MCCEHCRGGSFRSVLYGLITVSLVGIAGMAAFAQGKGEQEVLRARLVEILDKKGKTRMQIGMLGNDISQLQPCAGVAIFSEGGVLQSATLTVSGLGASPTSQLCLAEGPRSGQLRLFASPSAGAGLILLGREQSTLSLRAGSERMPTIRIAGTDDAESFRAPK